MEYQRVWAEINLDNIATNVKEIKKMISSKTKIMAIVKADGYGHGALEISKTALYNGADELGVAICDEATYLRENNIFVPILILGYTPDSKLSEVILNDLTQTVFSFEMASVISKTAVKLEKDVKIHIKIDTGMGRLGFLPTSKTIDEIEKIYNLPRVIVAGIYTHFAVADEKDKDYTYEQERKFEFILNQLKIRNIKIPVTHVSNSATTLDIKDFNFDLVRSGIILYGLAPSSQVGFKDFDLNPGMSLKTRVSYLKELEKNVSIGYGRTYFTNKKTKVATIPVGYADGYARSMGNAGRVLVNGEFAPIIGNICMDQFMIDVSSIENIKSGDEVVLFGKQNDNEISVDEIAQIQNTINYEIICNVGKRVPRVYMKNNLPVKVVYSN